MTRELCLESLQMQSPGTCLTAEGALLMAGAADGAVLSYDLRTPARLLSVVQTHQHPVVSILLQPGQTSNLVVTGSVNGEMKFCDLRNAAKPFYTTEVQRPSAGQGGRRWEADAQRARGAQVRAGHRVGVERARDQAVGSGGKQRRLDSVLQLVLGSAHRRGSVAGVPSELAAVSGGFERFHRDGVQRRDGRWWVGFTQEVEKCSV